MAKTFLGTGLTLHATISGVSSFNESQGNVWFPLLLAVVGMLPIAAGWANAFVHGEPPDR